MLSLLQYILKPLRYYKCKKHCPLEDNFRGREVSGKCGYRKPDPNTNECELSKLSTMEINIQFMQYFVKTGDEKQFLVIKPIKKFLTTKH